MFSLFLLLPEEYKYKISFIPHTVCKVLPYSASQEFVDKKGSMQAIPVSKLLI